MMKVGVPATNVHSCELITMRILFWNILHGGGPSRTPEIILAILEECADVVALCEFRVARGAQIRAALNDHGYVHQVVSHKAGRSNGMLLASRVAFEVTNDRDKSDSLLAYDFAGREIDVRIRDLAITAVHIADDAAVSLKAAHWNHLIGLARSRRDKRHLVLGDLNTARGNDTQSALACSHRLGMLSSLGYRDLWVSTGERNSIHRAESHTQSISMPSCETLDTKGNLSSSAKYGVGATWVAPWGEGRRIDAAWASTQLIAAVCTHVTPQISHDRAASYVQKSRVSKSPQRLSDHCALRVDLH